MPKRYNTPHRTHIIKTRMTEEEHADFMECLTAYGMNQSEFIRQAITGVTIKPSITVSPVNDELLAAVGKLTGEYGKIGGNLNQIARCPNPDLSTTALEFWGLPTTFADQTPTNPEKTLQASFTDCRKRYQRTNRCRQNHLSSAPLFLPRIA